MNRSLAVCSFLCFLLAFSALSLAHVDMEGDGGGHPCTEAVSFPVKWTTST